MPGLWYLLLASLFVVSGALSGIEGQVPVSTGREIVGCITRQANGGLQLLDRNSGRRYALGGNLQLLERHVSQLVALSANGGRSDSLDVDSVRVLSESCTSALPSKGVAAVAGKTGQVVTATPVTTTLSAGEVTPGFQTEAGDQQLAGTGAAAPYVNYGSTHSPYAPLNSEVAGQSEAAANTNAAAASRAEMYPGSTLGVTLKSPPPSSRQSMRQEKKIPQQNESRE